MAPLTRTRTRTSASVSVSIMLALLLHNAVTSTTANSAGSDLSPYKVRFDVVLAPKQYGTFVLEVHPEWAPLGAQRFREMLLPDADAFGTSTRTGANKDKQGGDQEKTANNFFKGVRFFRTIGGFMSQFGIHGKPQVASVWRNRKIKDDPVVESNSRGYVSFATSGKDSRTTQMFINLVNNANLDGMGFSPFARVVEGMDIVDQIYSGYGEGAPSGQGPEQGRIQSEGNKYLKRSFPKLSYIQRANIITEGGKGEL